MKFDIVIAGVGGQGVLSLSAIIASSALKEGLHVKQAEVHGMSQRGGAVVADLRLSDQPIHSNTIPRGTADLILGMEPLESLRYLEFLGPQGVVLASDEPVTNIPDYPPLDEVLAAIRALPRGTLIEAKKLAKQAGSHRASNVVMVGAASSLLPLKSATLSQFIRDMFARKGDKVVDANLKAFEMGREAVA
ncbi:MAG: indolepyruvate oxidoreductase subunit beta [Pseudomonadota bacterium]